MLGTVLAHYWYEGHMQFSIAVSSTILQVICDSVVLPYRSTL